MKLILKIDGTTASGGSPLVMHNERLADPLDACTRALAAISKKRNKTEADHQEMARIEFIGGMYSDPPMSTPADWTNGHKPCLPAWNILRCLQDGATRHKRGKDVLRGVYPLAECGLLGFDGADLKINELWVAGAYALRKTVGVQRARTVRTRPMFTDWTCELPIEVDSTVFDVDTLRQCWRDAGIYSGLGEMRPVYGRFTGTIEEVEA